MLERNVLLDLMCVRGTLGGRWALYEQLEIALFPWWMRSKVITTKLRDVLTSAPATCSVF